MATTIDSYSESNQDAFTILYSGSWIEWGQSFTATNTALSSVKFYLKKGGSPTGSAVAKLYAHSGVYGTSSLPTGEALATSDNFDVSTLTTDYALRTLSFTGANQKVLTDGEYYIIALYYNGGDSSNNIYIGSDSSSPGHSGNYCGYAFSWQGNNAQDTCFYVYGETLPVVGRGYPLTAFGNV